MADTGDLKSLAVWHAGSSPAVGTNFKMENIMEVLGYLIGMALVAWLNHYLATQRGRNAIGWAIGGALLGLLSTLLLLILGKTKEKELEILVEAQNMAASANK